MGMFIFSCTKERNEEVPFSMAIAYRKRGTHARVFSQTLAHGNSKNEIRQWNRRRRTEERREYGKK